MSNLADKLEVAHAAQTEGGDARKALDLFDEVRRQQDEVARALPAGMDAERFVRMVLTEIRRTPNLGKCDPATLLGAMMLSAQTGLEPGGPLGQAFLIPRYSSKRGCLEAQFQIGYKGLVQLAGRSGITLTARTVRQGDVFEWQYGTDEFLHHKPTLADEDPAPSIAWYAVGAFPDGRRPSFVVIDRNVTEAAKEAGKAGGKSPWVTGHYDAMAEKTAAIRLAKWLPLTTDVAMVIAADGAVVSGTVSVEQAAESVPLEDEDEPPALDAGEPDAAGGTEGAEGADA